MTAVCTAADGSLKEIVLSPTSPGIFEGDIDVSGGTGVYSINVRQTEDDTVVHSLNTALAVPYSREYRFSEDTGEFDAFVTSVSGKYISKPGEVFDSQLQRVYSVRPLTMIFMVLALVLFMADVILRRLGLYGHLLERISSAVKKEKPVKVDEIYEKSIKNTEKHAKVEKNSKKVIEKTQRRGYNKTDSVLDTNMLLQKKKDRDSKL